MTAPLRTQPSRLCLGRLCLGIDTGGTFTDAVVYDRDASHVLATAKTPTLHEDLPGCIAEAMRAVLGLAGHDSASFADTNLINTINTADIGLVAVSTTLATNALVEGAGRPAGLVAIGLEPDSLARVGLNAGTNAAATKRADATRREGALADTVAAAPPAYLPADSGLGSSSAFPRSGSLASAPVVFVKGGHSAHGDEQEPLDVEELVRALDRIDASVEAYAVAAQFSVRNAAHELQAQQTIRKRFGKPVTCSHELSSRLDGPRRAVTTLLNAQLISLTTQFTEAIRAAMTSLELDVPLMVVRGDGSLASADFVTRRPVETVLSGPAASVIGGCHLARSAATGRNDLGDLGGADQGAAGLADVDLADVDQVGVDLAGVDQGIAGLGTASLVVDIGGTTTDIAAIRSGAVVAVGGGDSTDTATVGGHATMVTALPTVTIGVGGDSEVWIPPRGSRGELALGPRRVVPLCVSAMRHPQVVLPMLRRQLEADRPLTEFGQVLLSAANPGNSNANTDPNPGTHSDAESNPDSNPDPERQKVQPTSQCSPAEQAGQADQPGSADRSKLAEQHSLASQPSLDSEILLRLEAAGGALALDELKRSARWRGALERLERSGRVRRSAMTPTDACVVLGLVGAETEGAETVGAESLGAESLDAESLGAETVGAESLGAETVGAESLGAETVGAESLGAESLGAETVGDRAAAHAGAELFSSQRDRFGARVGAGAIDVSRRIMRIALSRVTEALLGAALGADGIAPSEAKQPLAKTALERRHRELRNSAFESLNGTSKDTNVRICSEALWGLLEPSETPSVAIATPGESVPGEAGQYESARGEAGRRAAGHSATEHGAARPDQTRQDEPGQDEPGQNEPRQDEPRQDELGLGLTAHIQTAHGDSQPPAHAPDLAPLARIDAGVQAPIIAIGAPAATYAPLVGALLGTTAIVPVHAEVANAVGAAVAQVRITKRVTVTAPRRGSYRAHWGNDPPVWHSLDEAREWATEQAAEAARKEAESAGARDITIATAWTTRTAPSNGRELFVEATLRVTATGQPTLR